MKKYGKKIMAIFFTAVCFIGVLPFTVYGKTETVYVPPIGAITEDTRFSASNGGYITTVEYDAYTIPIPIDPDDSIVISFSNEVDVQPIIFYLDSDFNLITYEAINDTISQYVLNPSYIITGQYIVINVKSYDTPVNVFINSVELTMLTGSHTLASPERYEQIEVPDDPEPEPEADIVGNVLTMWRQILTSNIESLTQMYNQLTKPIALLFGVPLCIAIISFIFHVIGGKKR